MRSSWRFHGLIKAFDKVWHNGLLYEFQNNGTDGNLLCSIKFFLYHRHQRAVLNGQSSIWKLRTAGAP